MMNQNEAKTRTIGYLPIEKVQALKGWADYLDKSNKLSSLRTETQKAKNTVREALKQRLSETNEIDFAREVRPILSENCFACHGPDENARKAKLR